MQQPEGERYLLSLFLRCCVERTFLVHLHWPGGYNLSDVFNNTVDPHSTAANSHTVLASTCVLQGTNTTVPELLIASPTATGAVFTGSVVDLQWATALHVPNTTPWGSVSVTGRSFRSYQASPLHNCRFRGFYLRDGGGMDLQLLFGAWAVS